MDNTRSGKLGPLSGVVFVVLVVAATVLINLYDYLPEANSLTTQMAGRASQIALGGYLGVIGSFFLVWFTGSVYGRLREVEGGAGRLATLAFGGGALAGVLSALSFVLVMVAGQRAGTPGGLDPVAAVTLYDAWGAIMGSAMPVMMAVLVGATAGVALQKGAFPAWFGWVSAIIAVGLVSPISYIVIGLGIAWIVVVSIWLTVRGTRGTAGETSGEMVAEAA
jgi:hypothetical protein